MPPSPPLPRRPALALALILGGCFWRPEPGEAPLALAEAPVRPLVLDAAAERLTIVVAVRAGSAIDPSGREGLAWLAAETVATGGTRARGPAEVARQLAAWDARLHTEVGPEIVRFTLDCPPAHAAEAAALLGELVVAPGLDEGALAEARARGLAFFAELPRAPERDLAEAVLGVWLHESHPYGHLPQGRPGGLSAASRLDVEQLLARRYVRSALRGGVSGPDLPERARAAEALGEALSRAAPLLSPAPTPRLLPARTARALLAVDTDGAVAALAFGQSLDLSAADPDGLALSAGVAALNARLAALPDLGATARLAGAGERVQSALVVSLRPPSPEQAADALARALRVAEGWARDGVEPSELPNPSLPAPSLASALDAELLDAPAPSAETLAPARVNAAIARRVRPDQWSIVAALPDAQTFRAALVEYPAGSNVKTTAATPGAGSDPEAAPGTDYIMGIDRVSILPATELFR